jgi:hypothetical protein
MRECYPPGNEKKIICSNGFVIGREIELIKGARRSNINMIKETDQISLIWK